jgi:hypothetical protein
MKNTMFVSEHGLFSTGIINLPLEAVSLVVINTIQIERRKNTLDYSVEIGINHG